MYNNVYILIAPALKTKRASEKRRKLAIIFHTTNPTEPDRIGQSVRETDKRESEKCNVESKMAECEANWLLAHSLNNRKRNAYKGNMNNE